MTHPLIGASAPLHLLSLSKKKFPFTVLVSWNFCNDLSDCCLATEAETAEKIFRVQGTVGNKSTTSTMLVRCSNHRASRTPCYVNATYIM